MTAIADILVTVNPSDGATGVPLNNNITILFNTELDEWSIEHGGLILEGPDTDQVIYPGYEPTHLVDGTEKNILESPGYRGIVPGKFEFFRVDTSSTNQVSTLDTVGDGTLYRTKVIFKPSQPLAPNTQYKLYIVGDDDTTDTEFFGLRTRTVFDGLDDNSNTGNGVITFSGTYLGSLSQDTLNIRIVTAGVPGVATFEAWRTSVPLDLVGPFLTSSTESQILDGISAQFVSGEFQEGDVFTVKVKAPTVFTSTNTVSFTSGNGSLFAVPSSTATSVTGDPQLFSTTGLAITKTTPADTASNVSATKTNQIVLEFNEDIDPSTVTQDSVMVTVEPVIDHPLLLTQVPTGPISNTITVSGNKIIIDL